MKRTIFFFICLLTAIGLPHDTNAQVQNGTLVKSAASSAVYVVINETRYAFPNEQVFFSWYKDFSGVVTISSEALADYPLKGNVTYRPGIRPVKIQTDPKVYAVSQYGVLHWITSEAIASELFGSNWATRVHDIPDTFFLNYEVGDPILNANEYSPLQEQHVTAITQNIEDSIWPYTNEEQTISSMTNDHRQSLNVPALTWNEDIAVLAREHSINMANGTVPFGHAGLEERIEQLKNIMDVYLTAENVAYVKGYENPGSALIEGWLRSPSHLVHIEDAAFQETGVGVTKTSDGTYYATQIFIRVDPVVEDPIQ